MKSNIRKLRNEKQITQAELARVIGKTQQAVSQMEKDRDHISIDSLIAMAEYFGVSTDYILGIDGAKASPAAGMPLSEQAWLNNGLESLASHIANNDDQILYKLIISLLLLSIKDGSADNNITTENKADKGS